ncbi:ABC transporter permease [Emcibacter nanhaiensis]|uniref:FtsX-like permease family protein n=1 Tax=Emcibacter nanhaiensis TaxID=1505037 RepID=A0A501PSA8_9PROT|nr:FtsX-like permease family protein [Emcibacter nanhaiensis]TPD62987.1 FtsX-like permease family protein [Emcibacter nanhaiensis]
MNTLPTALRFALRELRSGIKRFRIFLACLFLGTAIIASVGSVTTNITEGLSQEARQFLGGDIEISMMQRDLTPAEEAFLSAHGTISRVSTLRAMAHLVDRDTEDSSLVELKAVDELYPLFGTLKFQGEDVPSDLYAEKDGRPAIVISEALANRLALGRSDLLKLGNTVYYVSAIVTFEPDRSNQGLQLAPGALMSYAGLEASGLVQPGSLIRNYFRLKLNDGIAIKQFKNDLKAAFPDADWRVRDRGDGGMGIRRFVERLGQFLSLVGLTALLVGGVGVSNAVTAYLSGKTATIATFKILGARSGMIMQIYLIQVLLMAALATAAGLVLGGLMPMMIGDLLGRFLPVPIAAGLYFKPLLLAGLYSLLITLAFTLWPLSRAQNIPAARLFRQLVHKSDRVKYPKAFIALITGLLALLVGLVVWQADHKNITLAFLAGTVVAFAVLYGAGWLIRLLARKMPRPKSPTLRIALSNIHRPGNATISVVLSLGLGLILFTAIALTENNITREINGRASLEAPSYFFIDIQKNQYDAFTSFLGNLNGVKDIESVPNLRGRITHIKDTPSEEMEIEQEGRWMLRGDRGLTFTDKRPENNPLTAGEWWPEGYNGPPQVSISREMADYMHLKLGDSITVNVLGRSITAEIVSMREVDWDTYGINYVVMFDPETLKPAPYTYLATAKVAPELETATFRAIAKEFPNVSIVRMKEVLSTLQDMLLKIGAAVDVMAAITILAGILVLAGAIAAGHKRRVYDAAVFKILGATRKDVLRAYVLEFVILGLAAGLVAIGLGTLAAWGIVVGIMNMDWHFALNIPALTISVSIAFTLISGMMSIWLAMSARPAQVLREI